MELHQKYIQIQQIRDSDGVYIEKLQEELIKIHTKLQIYSDERELLAKINEELSISNHLKETELISYRSYTKPSEDYRYALEMNISLENKLRSYEGDINMLKLQLMQKNETIRKLEAVKAHPIQESKEINTEDHSEDKNIHQELQSLIKEFNTLLTKYKKTKEKKNQLLDSNEKLKEKIQLLSTQVQSDRYLILHLQNKLNNTEKQLDKTQTSEVLLDRSKSELKLTKKPKSVHLGV
jgi:chromosome segregation ATPase